MKTIMHREGDKLIAEFSVLYRIVWDKIKEKTGFAQKVKE